MGVSYLGNVAEDLLAVALDGLAPLRTGHPAPDRVYVAHGAPAVDLCDGDGLLVVYLDAIDHVASRGGGRMPGACVMAATAVYKIELWRCVPSLGDNGEPLAAADYEDSALDLLVDLWALLGHLYLEWAAGQLGAPCHDVQFGAARVMGPSGGAAGFLLPVSYTLNDTSSPVS